jgi:hypothetical protein
MKLERSDVEFPIWRKKVDKSLFEHNGTTVPVWACRMWALGQIYGGVASRKNSAAAASVLSERKRYDAWVTTGPHGRGSPAFRLWFDEALSLELKHAFLMSYMRSLEGSLSGENDVESRIPFWEFLDIEFDQEKRVFRFAAYYSVRPAFPHLFKRLIGSPAIKRIDDAVHGKDELRIHKQDWKPRAELEYKLGARNVIYMLLDSEEKRVYVGEAEDLVGRLLGAHPSIPKWNFFRYDVLPPALGPFRVAFERMLIRAFATVLQNKCGIRWIEIGGCTLTNDKVDR